MKVRSTRRGRPARFAAIAAIVLAPLLTSSFARPALAAKSDGCAGGDFKLVNKSTNAVIASGTVNATFPAASFGTDRFAVRGLYNEFDVRLADFAVFDYAFTGAPNPLDMTGGVRTPVWASKLPDHRGLVLTSGISVEESGGDLVIIRTGTGGLTMKIQAKDCAAGGNFQMEVARGDGTRTRITHTLVSSGRSVPRVRLHQHRNGAAQPVLRASDDSRERCQRFLQEFCSP